MLWSEGPRTLAVESRTSAGKIIWAVGQTSGGGVTLLRIRGAVSYFLEVVTTIGDGFTNVGFGIGIVSTDAFAAGSTAVPGPLEDPAWDWMWAHYAPAVLGSTVTEEFKGLASARVDIDSKAMRKVKPNQTVFGIMEVEVEIGAATLSFAAMTRMLFKLG